MISGAFCFLFIFILFDCDAGLCDFCKINNEKRLKNDVFTNKIVTNIFSHSILKDCLTPRAQRRNTRSLRYSNEFDTPRNKT